MSSELDPVWDLSLDEFRTGPEEWRYSPDQPRDELGRFGEGGGGIGTSGEIKIYSIAQAIKVLAGGKGVQFTRPTHVVTLLHELNREAQAAWKAGDKAQAIDLCNVSVPGTNLFCAENVHITRDHMPQLKGVPTPGSVADSLPKDSNGEVNLAQQFKDYMGSKGYKIESTTESASLLRASQSQLDGSKVASMMSSMEAGTFKAAPIFISKENYVVDGHHTWAATVGYSLADKQDLRMDVARVDLPILQTLKEANDFAASMGIPQAAVTDVDPNWKPPTTRNATEIVESMTDPLVMARRKVLEWRDAPRSR